MENTDWKTPNLLEYSDEEIYLEWFNNFLSIEYMAEYYDICEKVLEEKINKGREDHYNKG